MKVYKIKTPKGFSNGSITPNFTKKGKLWNNPGALKNHLNLFRWGAKSSKEHGYKPPAAYQNPSTVEVIEYELTPVRTVTLEDMLIEMKILKGSPLKKLVKRLNEQDK